MKDRILRFLTDIDAALVPTAGGEHLRLYHIGRSSLAWAYGFTSATVDIDVVHLGQDDSRLMTEALRVFGRGTPKAAEHGFYLERVPEGLPPVPAGFDRRAREVEERWLVIRLFHLEPHDLAATKLKRFSLKDREDVRELCDRGLLDPVVLEARLASAFLFSLPKDGDPYRDAAFEHLRIVQNYLRTGAWG